ncbi:MAG: hypothetical protein DYH05_12905 [Acidobacteria bacterium ACB1]|nr:hypothetical protein [Pyrinomonadaceae bacterium]MCE7963379.1 hypothetical protein [Acidobacteria bacterium ACB1]RIJ95685.1 MAG: hypothetical protein DCC44_01895 [Acidobacteriota bacterium]
MDPVHVHLFLNHFPVICSVLAVPLFVYAYLRKSDALKELALLVLVFAAAVTIPVYLSGEPAEEVVEKLAGVSHDLIEQHEDAAYFAMISMMITGAISLIGLITMFLKKTGAAKFLVLIALLSAVGSAGLMLRTSNLGGQIRHSEIRTGDPGTQPGERQKDDQR